MYMFCSFIDEAIRPKQEYFSSMIDDAEACKMTLMF